MRAPPGPPLSPVPRDGVEAAREASAVPANPSLRPRAARWFELLVARDDTTLALEALAATGAVELEARSGAALPPSYADLRPLLQQFAELAQRYRAWWPRDGLRPSAFPEPPGVALQRCIERLRAWAAEAAPLLRRLQPAQAGGALLEQCLSRSNPSTASLPAFPAPIISTFVFRILAA